MQQTQTQLQRNKYLESAIKTATPEQLLIMLYDGAIRFCKAAIEAINNKKYEAANHNIQRARNIISEFIITLDKKAPIAENLLSLYEYFQRRLREANIKKQTAPVEEVLGHLIELREAWAQAAKIAKQGLKSHV